MVFLSSNEWSKGLTTGVVPSEDALGGCVMGGGTRDDNVGGYSKGRPELETYLLHRVG